jgi:hypothetical protein
VKLRFALSMLVVGLASACGGGNEGSSGGGGGDGESGTINMTLDEQNGSGKSATAELHSGAASVDVTIEVDGKSENESIHVHKGTCEAPGAEVVHDIGFTTADLGTGQMFVTMPEVATGEYVMDIHDANSDEVVMCGVIPKQ